MKANDIVVYPTLFGDFEATNAGNFFDPKHYNPDRVLTLGAEKGFKTAEDCRRFIIEELQPIEGIEVFCL